MYFRVALTLALLLPQATQAQNTVSPLAGLRAVQVVVESLPPRVAETGLVASQIQTDVELRLRQSGIQVLSDASAILYVNINMTSYEPQDVHAYTVTVELERPVTLPSLHNATLLATVWSARSSIGMAPLVRAALRARESLSDQVSQFLNEWLAADSRR